MSTTQVRRNGPYAPLGANYADDDAIATLDLQENDRAELLWCRGLAYCARDPRTEGYISDIALRAGKVLRRRPGKKNTDTIATAAQVLADLGLWTREGDGYRISAWLKWNKSWTEISRTRLKDSARKGGPGEESAGNDDGSGTDSERNPRGIRAPRHGTAVHGTAVHGSSTPPGAADGAPDTRGGTTTTTLDQALLDEHLTHRAMPDPAAQQLHQRIIESLREAGEQDVRDALTEWRRRPGAKPGLLPHLVADVVAQRTAEHAADNPTDDPEVAAWVAEQTAKRAAAAGAR